MLVNLKQLYKVLLYIFFTIAFLTFIFFYFYIYFFNKVIYTDKKIFSDILTNFVSKRFQELKLKKFKYNFIKENRKFAIIKRNNKIIYKNIPLGINVNFDKLGDINFISNSFGIVEYVLIRYSLTNNINAYIFYDLKFLKELLYDFSLKKKIYFIFSIENKYVFPSNFQSDDDILDCLKGSKNSYKHFDLDYIPVFIPSIKKEAKLIVVTYKRFYLIYLYIFVFVYVLIAGLFIFIILRLNYKKLFIKASKIPKLVNKDKSVVYLEENNKTFIQNYIDMYAFIQFFLYQQKTNFLLPDKKRELLNFIRNSNIRELAYKLERMKDFYLNKIELAKDVNPITLFAGNTSFIKKLYSYISDGKLFTVAIVNINNYRSYIYKYGFTKAESVIRIVATILHNTLYKYNKTSQIYHIDEDIFVFFADYNDIDEICQKIIKLFDASIKTFYTPEENKQGFIYYKDRRGQVKTFSLMNLLIAVVSNKYRKIEHPSQVTQIAEEILNYLRKFSNSSYLKDRRRDEKN